MKKYLLFLGLVIVFCFVSENTFSQQTGDYSKYIKEHKSKFSIDFAAGPQFSNISSVGTINTVGKTAFFVDISGYYQIIDNVHIGVGISFDRRSFGLNLFTPFLIFTDTISYKSNSTIDLDYNTNYLTIPLNIKYIAGENDFNFFIQGTFYYSFYISTYKYGYTNVYIHPDDYQYIDPDENPQLQPGDNIKSYNGKSDIFFGDEKFNSFDFGLIFYLGLSYNISENINIYLSTGFSSSFGRLLENPDYKTSKWSQNIKIKTGITYNFLNSRR